MKQIGVWSLILWCTMVQSAPELMKVFYHRGGDSDATIELGKIVFYFSKDSPLKAPVIDKKNGTVEFKFEGAHAPQAVIDVAKTLFKSIDSRICTAHLVAVTGKRPSVILRITYDPTTVGFESALFDAIQHEKGFACTLLNTQLLDRLSPTNNNILRVVSHKPGIVIDMGHGGEDTGALSLGCIPEKEITRSIGLKVSELLRSQGFTVFFTRSEDTFVPLDTRTSFFNQCHADILVSIHANSGGPQASGVETFCYKPLQVPQIVSDSLSTPQRSARTANSQESYDLSMVLAQLVQNSVVEQVKKKQHLVVNRGVKKAISQILLGAVKPSVLIEVGFMTHPVESTLLACPEYQHLIACGICRGICAYFKQLNVA